MLFFYKCIDSLRKAFINPLELCGVLLMMDGCSFLGFKISSTIHCPYKAWKSQDMFWYNSDYSHLKEESHIHLLNSMNTQLTKHFQHHKWNQSSVQRWIKVKKTRNITNHNINGDKEYTAYKAFSNANKNKCVLSALWNTPKVGEDLTDGGATENAWLPLHLNTDGMVGMFLWLSALAAQTVVGSIPRENKYWQNKPETTLSRFG